MRKVRLLLIPALALVAVGRPATARAADVYADLTAGEEFTSNVYLDRSREWDFVTVPELLFGVGFADAWAVEYEGEVDVYARHPDLFYHRHTLGLLFDPTWGEEDENRFSGGLSCRAQQHTDSYDSINHVEPALDLEVRLEPTRWLAWSLSQGLSYRLFYNDTASDSLDLWTEAELTFTLPSRTTLGPRAGYGFRYYPRQDLEVTDDTTDHQITVGAHVSQALGERGGLRADYGYLHNFGASGLIERKLTDTEFTYLGEEFLFTGHRAEIGYKQLFGSGWSFGLEARFEWRAYDGWLLEDEGGGTEPGNGPGASDGDLYREDQRLAPRAWLEYAWTPGEDASPAIPELAVTLSYEYLRQWSNERTFDTDRHSAGLTLVLSW